MSQESYGEEAEFTAELIANHLKRSKHMSDCDMTLRISEEWLLDDFIPFVKKVILAKEREAWNQAVEECKKVALNSDHVCEYPFPVQDEIANDIEKLKKP